MLILSEQYCPARNAPKTLSRPHTEIPKDVLARKREATVLLICRVTRIYSTLEDGTTRRFHLRRTEQFANTAMDAIFLAEAMEADISIELTTDMEGQIILCAPHLLIPASLRRREKQILLRLFQQADSVHIAAQDGVSSMTFMFHLARR